MLVFVHLCTTQTTMNIGQVINYHILLCWRQRQRDAVSLERLPPAANHMPCCQVPVDILLWFLPASLSLMPVCFLSTLSGSTLQSVAILSIKLHWTVPSHLCLSWIRWTHQFLLWNKLILSLSTNTDLTLSPTCPFLNSENFPARRLLGTLSLVKQRCVKLSCQSQKDKMLDYLTAHRITALYTFSQ